MTITPLTLGISGCGAIGDLHASQLSHQGVALCFHNRRRPAAESFAEKFNGSTADSFEELLGRCDAVVIATPPEAHTEAVLAALAVGRSVLVEKPLCVTPEELQLIEPAANSSSAIVMVAENYYYKPSTLLLRETIGWGGIGTVEHIRVGKRSKQVAVGWKSAHGALLEGGIHFVALVADLMDAASSPQQESPLIVAPSSVLAKFPTWDGTPERQAIVNLTYGDIKAELHYAWDVPALLKGTLQHCRVDGSDGRILFECNGIYIDVRGPGRKGLSFPGFKDLMGYRTMTEEFLACVRGELETPYSDLQRARRDLGIVWQAYEQLPE